jgi:hypothetical protein
VPNALEVDVTTQLMGGITNKRQLMNNLETSTKQTMSHVFQENKLHHSSSTTQSVFTQNKNNKISLLTNT